MLQVLLALDRQADIIVMLGPNKTSQPISAGEPLSQSLPMLPGTPSEIAGDADVNRPIWPIRNDVNPSARHAAILGTHMRDRNGCLDGRVKPGHDAILGHCAGRI